MPRLIHHQFAQVIGVRLPVALLPHLYDLAKQPGVAPIIHMDDETEREVRAGFKRCIGIKGIGRLVDLVDGSVPHPESGIINACDAHGHKNRCACIVSDGQVGFVVLGLQTCAFCAYA